MKRYIFVIRQAFGTVLARCWFAQARSLSEATPNE